MKVDLPDGIHIEDSRSMEKVKDGSVTLIVTCYSDDTQVLTKNGWKLFNDLRCDDEIASLSRRHNMYYSKPSAIQKSYYKGEMIKISHRSIDLLVTPNHNLYLRKNKRKSYGFIKANKFPSCGANTINSINWKTKDTEYFFLPSVKIGKNKSSTIDSDEKKLKMDDFLEFLGWYIAEGSLNESNYCIVITQRKDKYKKEIGDCITRLGYNWSYLQDKDFRFNNKQLYEYLKPLGKCHEKYIPQEFMNLSRRQLQILFDAIVKGDGHVRKNGGIRISTTSKKLASQLQEIIVKIGYNSTIITGDRRGEKREWNGHTFEHKKICYEVNLRASNGCYLKKNNFEKVRYEGFVYCCTVPSNVILVRRKGKSVWCGNSPPYNVDLEYEKGQSFDDWLDLMKQVMKECDRVLMNGGRACINVASTGRNPYKPLFKHVVDIADDLGWWMRGTILWLKGKEKEEGFNLVAKASTAWGTYGSASNPILRDNHEFILVFSKGSPFIEKGDSGISDAEFVSFTNAEWIFQPATGIDHPAPFPDELARRCILLYSNKHNIVLDPFGGCYDDKTEILTEKRGFVLFEDLKKSDRVASLVDDRLEFVKPLRYIKYWYNDEMYRIKGRSIDLFITPDHNLYCKEYHQKEYRLLPVNELNYQTFHFKSTSKWIGKYEEYFNLPSARRTTPLGGVHIFEKKKINMNDWVEFLGYFLSEGSTTKSKRMQKGRDNKYNYESYVYVVKIAQKEGEKKDKIRDCLHRLPFHFVENKGKFRIYNKQLYRYLSRFGKSKEKYVPQEIKELDESQLKIFFDALVLGDGYIDRGGRINYYTVSPVLCDDVMEIMLKLGYSPSLGKRKGKNSTITENGKKRVISSKNISFDIRTKKSASLKLTQENIIKENYRGNVYCIEVPSHVIYVRRNHKCCWCGNSGTTFKVAKALHRIPIMYEKEARYIPLIKKRISEPVKIQSLALERYLIMRKRHPDLADKSTRELKDMAKRFGVRSYNSMTKIELIESVVAQRKNPRLDDFA